MNRIFANQEIMVLSDKKLADSDGYFLTFDDGSSVNISTRTVINKGSGEIIIRELPLWPQMSDVLKKQMTFDIVNHLIVSGDMNNIVILPNEGTECLLSVGGSDDFVQNSSISQRGDELYIETPKRKSNVNFNMGSIWVNGKRLPPRLEEDFGYVQIKCSSLYDLYVNSSGSGSIFSEVPIQSLKANINGSTSIDVIQLENAELDISGSGSLAVDELNGCLYGRISGSGSIEILTGLVENVDVKISGSGSLAIGAAVKTATLSLCGSGSMMIAHVLDEYTEQKSGSGFIRVLKVGA